MKRLSFLLLICSIRLSAQTSDKPLSVRYFTRSGWLIETEKHVLLMDYVPYEGVQFDDFVLNELSKANSKNKSVFVFISHEHEDHFYPKLFEWAKHLDNLQVVLGWNYSTTQANVHTLSGRDSAMIRDIKVWVHPATDAGSGFLIKVDDLTIYHAGDHAQWLEELKSDFEKETKYIAAKSEKITLAFLPVENRRKQVMDGAVQATGMLNPVHVFPMHSQFRDYAVFVGQVNARFPRAQTHLPQQFNQMFTIQVK